MGEANAPGPADSEGGGMSQAKKLKRLRRLGVAKAKLNISHPDLFCDRPRPTVDDHQERARRVREELHARMERNHASWNERAIADKAEHQAALAALLAQATKTTQRHDHELEAELSFVRAIVDELNGAPRRKRVAK